MMIGKEMDLYGLLKKKKQNWGARDVTELKRACLSQQVQNREFGLQS